MAYAAGLELDQHVTHVTISWKRVEPNGQPHLENAGIGLGCELTRLCSGLVPIRLILRFSRPKLNSRSFKHLKRLAVQPIRPRFNSGLISITTCQCRRPILPNKLVKIAYCTPFELRPRRRRNQVCRRFARCLKNDGIIRAAQQAYRQAARYQRPLYFQA